MMMMMMMMMNWLRGGTGSPSIAPHPESDAGSPFEWDQIF